MAPVRRLRSFAWMNARRFPGVRCSTLNTECRALLCLMIMTGRSWVAGMAICKMLSLDYLRLAKGRGSHNCQCGLECLFDPACANLGIEPYRSNRRNCGEKGKFSSGRPQAT